MATRRYVNTEIARDARQRMRDNPERRPEQEAFVEDPDKQGWSQVDPSGYEDALLDWMNNNERFRDWSDYQKQEFARRSPELSDDERRAEEFWQGERAAFEKAKGESREDRETMLAEIEAFRQGINENYVNQVLGRERQYHDAKIQANLRETEQRLASMGRSASPYLMGHLKRRMEAQAADKLQLRRAELEQEVQKQKLNALNQMQQVYGQTDRRTTDPATAMQIAQQMGGAAAGETDTGGGGGGGGTRTGGGSSSSTSGPRVRYFSDMSNRELANRGARRTTSGLTDAPGVSRIVSS